MHDLIHSSLFSAKLINEGESISEIKTLHGGSINESFYVRIDTREFFIKLNQGDHANELFKCEVKGLKLLKKSNSVKVPEILSFSSEKGTAVLVLEYIKSGNSSRNSWEDFGRSLAQLHSNMVSNFGLDHDNFIGTLVQKNTYKRSWLEFFVENRLEFQYALARNSGLLSPSFRSYLDRLYNNLKNLIPEESASLLHGDLWSGNYKLNHLGQACIFDPAVYYGHREVDLAMMHLFGGFDKKLFEAYNEALPLQTGWEERIDIFNLYPLFVHVNLFGGAYVSRLEQVLKKYV